MPPKAKAHDAAQEEIVRYLFVCIKNIKDDTGKTMRPNFKAVADELSMNFHTAKGRFRTLQIRYGGAAEDGDNDTGSTSVVTEQPPAIQATETANGKEESGKRKRQTKDNGSETKAKKKSTPKKKKKGVHESEKKPASLKDVKASEEGNDTVDRENDGVGSNDDEILSTTDKIASAN